LDYEVYDTYLSGKKYLLFFGRLQMHKGAHILAQALPYVFNRCPDLRVAFVGLDDRSPLGTSMRNYIRNINRAYEKRLIFLDAVHHNKLYPIIQSARLVVLPSLADNFPNTMLEAMGLGRPVLGTKGCSFDEIIEDDVSGFLAEPGDPKSLANKIISSWNYSDQGLDRISRQGQKRVEELVPEKTVEAVLDFYLKSINDH
jgi:glycosyltransferase involved in cell wall biosynthesis